MRFATRGKRGWVWPGVLAALIVVASSRSEIAEPDIVNIDKIGHFCVFGMLATLVVRNGFVPRFGWLAILIVSVFGMTDEWHQSFTPGRSVEFDDWLADTLGATLAVTLYSLWPWYRNLLEGPVRRQRQVEKSAEVVPNSGSDDASLRPEPDQQ
jgi:VanZ family protein